MEGTFKVRVVIITIWILFILGGCTSAPAEKAKELFEEKTGEWIESEKEMISKSAQIESLRIEALEYALYSNEKLSSKLGNLLLIDFKIKNIGANNVEHYPDKFVLVLFNGKQIESTTEPIEGIMMAPI